MFIRYKGCHPINLDAVLSFYANESNKAIVFNCGLQNLYWVLIDKAELKEVYDAISEFAAKSIEKEMGKMKWLSENICGDLITKKEE